MRNLAIALALLSLSFGLYSFSQPAPKAVPSNNFAEAKINWMTWEEALERSKTKQKKILVDVYTDWCGWCKRMDKATFQQAHIADYVNENYYAVKFNAETKEDIIFKGKTFKFVKNGMRGYHELAAEITRGRLSYPTVVFLNENLEVIQPVPGFKDPMEFEKIITYFGRNEHLKTPWDVYSKKYQPLVKKP